MSLAQALVDTTGRALDNHAEGWLDKGIKAAREKIADRRDVLSDELTRTLSAGQRPSFALEGEAAILALAPSGLDAIEKRSPALLRWGRGKAAAVLLLISDGEEDSARRLTFAGGMTLDQFAMHSDELAVITGRASQAQQQDMDDVVALLKEVGQGALRAALPFLLAAI